MVKVTNREIVLDFEFKTFDLPRETKARIIKQHFDRFVNDTTVRFWTFRGLATVTFEGVWLNEYHSKIRFTVYPSQEERVTKKIIEILEEIEKDCEETMNVQRRMELLAVEKGKVLRDAGLEVL